MSRQGIKRAVLYTTAVIVFLMLLAPFILDKLINSSIVKNKISFLIEQKAGIKIDQDKIDFLFLPQPGIRFKEVELSFGQMLQLDIRAVNVDIDVFKLIKGKLAVSKIVVETPKIRYTPQSNPQYPEDNSASPARPFHLMLPKQEIQELFALFPDSHDTLELIIKNVRTDYFESMDGSFFVSNRNQTLTLAAKLNGLNVRKDQFPENSPLQKLDINAIESDEISVSTKLDEAGIFTGTLRLKTPRVFATQIPENPLAADFLDFEFYFSEEYLSVRLKPVLFSYPQAKVGINFMDDKKAGKTAITFTGDDVDIAQVRKVCLNLIDSNQVVDHLFDILRGGTAREVTVGFAGNTLATLFDGENLFLTGSAENSLIKIPKTPLIAEKVYGDAVLKKGILHVKIHKGQVSTTLIKGGWLDINLMNHEDVPFKGEFNLHADLSTLPRVLISLLPDTRLSKELARVGKVSGQADAVLKLGMESMQKNLFVQVTTQNLSMKCFYDLIPLPITITQGQFFYEAERVTLKDFSGSLGDSYVKNLNSVIDFSQSPSFNISAAPAVLNLDEIISWLKSYDPVLELLSPVKNMNGQLLVDKIRIEGPIFAPEKWQFDINGSGRDINIGFAQDQDQEEIKSLSGRYRVTDQRIQVQGAKAQIEDLSWLSPAIDLKKLSSISLPIKIFETNFETARDRALFQGKVSFPSECQLFFDLTGKNIEDLYPRLLILKEEKMSDAMVMLNRNPSKPLLKFEGRLNIQTLEKILIKNSFLDDLVVSFSAGEPLKIFTDTDSNLHVVTDKINLDSLLAIEKQKKYPQNQTLFDHKILYLKTGRLTYKKRDFSNIDTRIEFKNGKTIIQILNAGMCNLAAKGVVELDHENQVDRVITDFTIRPVDNQDLSEALSCIFNNKNIIDGSYSFTCNLSGQASFDMISSQQNGTLTLNASNGRIYKWTFLSRLLSVLNILHFADITKQGIGYRTIVIEADIKDSVIQLKKAIIDADNMAIIFSGWIDPLNDKMDLTCLVAPFKTIDTIIKHIPIVNTLLSGRLMSFPAKATGSIADPVVTPLHPSAVGKGLVKMLGDILKTPVRLFEETP